MSLWIIDTIVWKFAQFKRLDFIRTSFTSLVVFNNGAIVEGDGNEKLAASFSLGRLDRLDVTSSLDSLFFTLSILCCDLIVACSVLIKKSLRWHF